MRSTKKHIILTKLFEFGGSNTHLKTLLKYFGEENVVLVLTDENERLLLKNIEGSEKATIVVCPCLYSYAHLSYQLTTNIKELFYLARSVAFLQFLSIKYRFASITICSVEPEKYLYFMWLPFSRVVYILHTAPARKYTFFTSFTCNLLLSKRKRIVTVSHSNKNLICRNWDIVPKKSKFVSVVYNCVFENQNDQNNDLFPLHAGLKVVTLGHVIGYKNPDVWLTTAKAVIADRSDVSFVWLGNGPLFKAFESATSDNNRINFIEGKGVTPASLLKQADIYYQPSLYETHGIAVVEAMSFCLPCVVSNVGGLPESIQHEFNGLLVDPLSVAEHVDAINRLLDDTSLRQKYGLNGRNKFRESFTYDNFRTKMDILYK